MRVQGERELRGEERGEEESERGLRSSEQHVALLLSAEDQGRSSRAEGRGEG